MSIFKDSFPKFVRTELTNRQNNIKKHDLHSISTLTNRTAWVRMVSGVDVGEDNAKTASQWVLFGGDTSKIPHPAFKGQSGYVKGSRGIRPAPGITSVNVDSISANGSLRKITVNFSCWDVEQLNILEQLYMRPGYTACIEWGWSHQLGDNKILTPQGFFGDKILNINNSELKGKSLLEIYKEAYKYTVKYKGNYDVCIGKISNYSYSTREDGGYDCSTTITTYGEILDSLKVNYTTLSDVNSKGIGLIHPSVPNKGFGVNEEPRPHYEKSFLLGMLQEIKMYSQAQPEGVNIISPALARSLENYESSDYKLPESINPNSALVKNISSNSKVNTVLYSKYVNPINNNVESSGSLLDKINYRVFSTTQIPNSNEFSDFQLPHESTKSYIMLTDFCKLISDFIIPETEYGKITAITTTPIDINPDTIKEPGIKVNAYPIQLPMDLNVCVFYPKLWTNLVVDTGEDNVFASEINNSSPTPVDNDKFKDQIDFLSRFNQRDERLTSYVNFDPTSPSYIHNEPVNKYYTTVSENNASDLRRNSPAQIEAFNDKLKTYLELYTRHILTLRKKEDGKLIYSDGVSISYADVVIDESNDLYEFLKDKETSYIIKVEVKDNLEYYALDENKRVIFDHVIKSMKRGFFQHTGPLPYDLAKEVLSEITIKGTTPYWNKLWEDVTKNTTKQDVDIASTIIRNIFEPLKDYQYFTDNTYSSAYIGNIFVNIDFIMHLVEDNTSQDPNGKNELSFTRLFNSMLSAIQNSIGSINDLRIHVDPTDNIARIVDIDYVNKNTDDLFRVEVLNDKSVVKNLKLESMIFPEQSSIISISAQTKSGTLGYGNQHLVAYNRGIEDRIITKLDTPIAQGRDSNTQSAQLIALLSTIASYYKTITTVSEEKKIENSELSDQ